MEPKAFVGRSLDGGIHWTFSASASLVRQMPPPADATHIRQPSSVLHTGSTASAATRPDSWVVGPCCVTGSKNCDASPDTFGVTGPSRVQCPGAATRAVLNAPSLRNADRGAVRGTRRNA